MTRCRAIVLAFVVLTGCPDESVETPDAGSDVPFDTAPPPYTCDYAPSGNFEQATVDECNLIAQDCPSANSGCYVTTSGARCLAFGDAGCGATCEEVNDCARGQVCVGEPSRCRALCRAGDPCPGDTVCRELAGRDDVGFCPVPCSVLEQGCPDAMGCYLINGHQECAPPVADPAGEGEACDFVDECEPGLLCQDAADPRCLGPCTTDGQVPCEVEGTTCAPLAGLEPLGVCL